MFCSRLCIPPCANIQLKGINILSQVASDQSAKNQSDGGGCGALSSRNDHVEIGTSPVSSSLSQTLSTVKKEERLSQPPTTLSHRSTPIQRSPSNHWRPLSPTVICSRSCACSCICAPLASRPHICTYACLLQFTIHEH